MLLSGLCLFKQIKKKNTNSFVSFDCINKWIISSCAQFNSASMISVTWHHMIHNKSYSSLNLTEFHWKTNLDNSFNFKCWVTWLISFNAELNCACDEIIHLLIQSKLTKLLVFFFSICLNKQRSDDNTRWALSNLKFCSEITISFCLLFDFSFLFKKNVNI